MFIGANLLVAAGCFAAGFLASSSVADAFSNYLHDFFNLARSEQLEVCARFLNVHHKASKQEVQRAFRILAKKYHPDAYSKGGDQTKFIQLTNCVELMSHHRDDLI